MGEIIDDFKVKNRTVEIKQVDNGYILKMTEQGESTWLTKYEIPTLVFNSFMELTKYLTEIYITKKQEE